MNDKPKCVIYARVSTRTQAEEDHYSLPQQLSALREYAVREDYEVLEEVEDPGYSGATLNRPGLDRVHDLVRGGGVSVVLAQDRDRFAREPALLYLLKEEFAEHGCKLRALNGQGDDSPEGELTDGILDQLAKYERAKIAERTRRGKLQKARQGRVLPSRNPPYGFVYDREAHTYRVDEATMGHVRRIFRMVGAEDRSMTAVKNAFERDSVRTPGGAKNWYVSTIRRIIGNDIYLARPHEEVAEVLSPEVAAALDRECRYSLYWFNRKRVKRLHTGTKTYAVTENDPASWVAAPIEDPGIPPDQVRAARANVEGGTKWPSAGGREWELKRHLRCSCGRSMIAYTTYRRGTVAPYYVCTLQRQREGGEHAGYHAAEKTEERVRQFVLGLIRQPEVLRGRIEADIEREKANRRNVERERVGWLAEIQRIENKQDTLIEMRTDGDIPKEKFREKMTGLDARKAAAERELEVLKSNSGREELLDSLPALIEEYLADLPDLVDQMPIIREHETIPAGRSEDNPLGVYRLTPERVRHLSEEALAQQRRAAEEARSRRYRALYELLELKVVANADRSLEVSGTFGVRDVRLAVGSNELRTLPRRTARSG